MRPLILSLLFALSITANAATPEHYAEIRKGWGRDGLHKHHCKAAEEYIKTLEFLRKDKTLPESEARQVAGRVSAGCTGASERFSKAYLTMRKSGVSLPRSVEVGVALVNADPLTVKNFHEIFEKMYLGEYFDVNFKSSFEIALELSKDFQGNLDMVRADFNQFSKLCMDHKKMGLSINQCAKLAVKFARLSQYFPKGIFADFNQIYSLLREDKRFGLSLSEALDITEKVLSSGPAGRLNFIQAYNYASMKQGLNLTGREALKFGLQMAGLSYIGDAPPVFPGEQVLRSASRSDTAPEISNTK